MNKKKGRHSIRIKMMGINISIALVSFLLCGGLFVISISLLIGKYINSDMDFFLTEITDNLSEKFEYMEDTISEIRDSVILMDYLEKGYEFQTEAEVQKTFSHLIDINNLDNQRTDWEPIIEEVYIFREQGEFIAEYYYMLVSREIEESHELVASVWEETQQERTENQGFDSYVVIQDDSMYIACPILNDKLTMCGSVIFNLNLESVHLIMTELKNYEDAFWILYDDHENILDGEYMEAYLENMDFLEETEEVLYSQKIAGEVYRLYHKELGVNLNAALGIPENHAARILYDSIDLYVVMIVLILAVGILSFAVFTYKITKPLEEVSEKLKSVKDGDFQTKMPEYKEKEFYEISNGFNRMTSEIDHLITEVYEKQILLKELELKFLQSQLNPHFIFNVLNAISMQANMDGNKQLGQTISTFSKLIQAKIYRSDLEKVKILQELEYAEYYLQIQKFRFGERLSYMIDVDETLMDYYIQKLSIQMIVENAVVHGLEPKIGGGTVYIRGYKDDGDIIIEIEDDGVGFDTDGKLEFPLKTTSANEEHNQVGLNNIHSILQLRYGNAYGLSIVSEIGKGTTVKIQIPFDTGLE